MMLCQRLIALACCAVFLISAFPIASDIVETTESYSLGYSTSYPNSAIASLIVSRNGSHPGDPYPGANVTPMYGMSYFGTNVVLVSWDYSIADLSDPALFPTDCRLYLQVSYDVTYLNIVANEAVNDSRIKGVVIDDFRVGQESPSNMSAYYTALHHEDTNLSENLALMLAVYNLNYFKQSPYNWSSVSAYFDIINYWYYPFNYGLLFPGFAGYEDDFLTFKSWIPTKEFWLGIYIHYYDIGEYPASFTYEQMSIAGRLIKQGHATKYEILADFWIQHNTDSALLVKNFINNEFQMNYTTVMYMPTTTFSYQNGIPILNNLITTITPLNLSFRYYLVPTTSYTFTSLKMQTLIIHSATIPITQDYVLIKTSNGDLQTGYWDIFNQTLSFVIEPWQQYRLKLMPFDSFPVYYGDVELTGAFPITWINDYVTIYGKLRINATFYCINSVIRFGDYAYNNSMVNGTTPYYGIQLFDQPDDTFISIIDSVIEPVIRSYPFDFNGTFLPTNTKQALAIEGSYIACYYEIFKPRGKIYLNESTFFQVQPSAASYYCSLWLEAPSCIFDLKIRNVTIWNYEIPGTIGLFIMPWNLYTIGNLVMDSIDIIGGNYGISIDLSWSDTGLVISNFDCYSYTDYNSNFVEIVLNGISTKEITITTHSIFDWSVKSSSPGPQLTMFWPSVENGIYTLTTDSSVVNFAVTTNTISIYHDGNWNAINNNFTLTLYGVMLDSETNFTGLLWLLIFFFVPIAITQAIPKIGFLVGAILMLVIIGFAFASFAPYMLIGFISIGVYIYKGM